MAEQATEADPFDDERWSIELVAAWVIWRSRKHVAQLLSTLAERDGHVHVFDIFNEAARTTTSRGGPPEGALVSFQQAQAELWEQLKNGGLRAIGLKPGEATWSLIGAQEWENLDYFFCEGAPSNSIGSGGIAKYSDVSVPREATVTLWPKLTPQNRDGLGINARKRKALEAAIKAIGFNVLDKMPQKVREPAIQKHIEENFDLTVSDKFIRSHFRNVPRVPNVP